MRLRGTLPRGSIGLLSTLLSMAMLTACGWKHKEAPAQAGSGGGATPPAPAAGSTIPDRIAAPIVTGDWMALPGTAHSLALPRYDQGPVDGSMQLNGLVLAFKTSAAQQAQLDTLLAAQLDPKSPEFRRWVNPGQFGERFGLSGNDLTRTMDWLRAQGFEVQRASNSRTRIYFSGTAAQVSKTFHTEIHRYLVDGEMHFANSTSVGIPKALGDSVFFLGGLNDFNPKAHVHVKRGSGEKHGGPKPVSNYTIGSSHFIAPADLSTIYDIDTLFNWSAKNVDGTGASLAIVGQTSILTADVANFRTLGGLPTIHLNMDLVSGSGSSSYESPDDMGEAYLDIEWSSAVAKNATINFVYTGGGSGYSVWNSLEQICDSPATYGSPTVISSSYGYCESGSGQSFSNYIEGFVNECNGEGITIVSSSGDSGAAGCDTHGDPAITAASGGLSGLLPTDLAGVTGAGGTEFNDSTGGPWWSSSNGGNYESALSYIPETSWNDSALGGGLAASTGGVSAFYSKPSWQTGTGVPADGQRDMPDIAMTASADHDGYVLCLTDTTQDPSVQYCVDSWGDSGGYIWIEGGTSAAAPVFAGSVLLLSQSMGTGLGNINPTLYSLAAGSTTSAAFHDITTGNNIVPCVQGTTNCPSSSPFQYGYSAGTGYDLVTGLGSVDVGNLWKYWPTATTTSLVANPTSAALGSSVTLTATVSTGRIGPSPTGTVTFKNGGATLGSQSVTATNSSGIEGATAAISVTTLPAGTDTVTAIYAGDTTYGTSTSSGTTVTISGNTFSIAANPTTVTVGQGGSAGTSTISTTLTGGSNQSVALTAAGVPTGATASFSPASVTTGNSSTLTLTPGTAAIGSYTVTVSGTGTMVAQATVTFDIVSNDFSISASPSSTSIAQLGSGTTTLNTSVTAGVAQSVALSISGLPSGASAGFSPASVNSGSSSTLTIQPGTAATGTYTLTVTGTGSDATHTTTVSLTVTASDFTLSASPTSVSIQQSSAGTSTISTSVSSGSAETITLSASGLPFNSAASFSPAAVTAGSSSTLTLNPNTAAPGPYTVTITGTGQLTSHTTSVTMTITAIPNDFSLSASPSSLSIVPGASGASTITSTLTSGATQAITWSVTGVPTGASATFSPTSTNAGRSTLLTIDSGSAVANSYTLTITGTGTSATHTTTVSVNLPALGQGAVRNGGFETATLTGWTTTKGSASVVGTPHSGNDSAQVGLATPTTDSAIAQTFTPATNATTLAFWYQVVCPGVVASDWATASVTDNVTGVTTTMLAHTCTNNGMWSQASTTITGGHSQTLALANHDNDQAGASTYTLYDDVTVQ